MISTDVKQLKKTNYRDHERGYTIYSLINLDNNKRYIGRTKNQRERIQQHFYDLKGGRHSNKSLNKDCMSKFGYEILETNIMFADRTNKERQYIIWYRTYDERYGYNLNDPCMKDFS